MKLLSDEKLELVIQNIAVTKDGKKFFEHILASSGMFNIGFNGNSRDIYNKGRSDFGLEIRDLLMQYAMNDYIEIIKEGAKDDHTG